MAKTVPTTKGGRPYIKMSAIREATGLPRSTVLHYVNENLLTSPVKTGPNMAYYHPDTVDRIRLIRQLQTEYRLPLTSIRKMLSRHDGGENALIHAKLQDALFGEAQEADLDINALADHTDMRPEEIQQYVDANVIMPLMDNAFTKTDAAMAELVKDAKNLGITPDDISFYIESAKTIVSHEMQIHERLTKGLPQDRQAEITLSITRLARSFRAYIIDRVFLHHIMDATARSQNEDCMVAPTNTKP